MTPASFVETLHDLRKGAALAEAGDRLQALVAAVRDTGKAGKLTLTIEVKPTKGDHDILTLHDGLKVALPEPDRGVTIMYATDHNTLQRQDPRQPALPDLRDVSVGGALAGWHLSHVPRGTDGTRTAGGRPRRAGACVRLETSVPDKLAPYHDAFPTS